ncbi:tryptophan-rich sensory protein [Pseudonocardiaceae bacterium YIM PH 21723]|nr:tryptophan-rich sensory protein [Pseudonocardiaceae bacterium YIM PH 21723]
MIAYERRAHGAIALGGFFAAVAAVAAIGALSASRSRDVYATLVQPVWAPPAWLFGPVWTILYVAIAVSGWLYWQTGGTRRGLAWYAVGLVLNAAWTPLFFAAGAYFLALVDVLLLAAVIVVTVLTFRRHTALGAGLLLPYLAWTLFAAALNAAILVLN